MASLKQLELGFGRFDTFETADVLLDALISINTPLLLSRLQLDALILICLTLFAGLFTCANPKIYQQGRPEIYKFKNGKPYGFRKCESAARYVEYVKTIKYDRNLSCCL